MNRMLVTIRTEFFQFQSTRCIVSIFLSNISGNAPRFFIQTISGTTGTFQNNYDSDIFTLGHEPPLDLLNSSVFDSNRRRRKEEKKIEEKLLTRNPIQLGKISLQSIK